MVAWRRPPGPAGDRQMDHALLTPVRPAPGAFIVHEDEHLLVINKPAGWNTHAPSPYAGEGVYDWLRHREPRWATLAIIHRLDKETSGLMVFGKTPAANRSLTEQFARRAVTKEYRLATAGRVTFDELTVRTGLRRRGEVYEATAAGEATELAETKFRRVGGSPTELWAAPVTGKTHQIRVHAAARGFPILGDTLYGGAPAGRLWLHAERLAFAHPASGESLEFHAPADFTAERFERLRAAIIDPASTNAFRMVHGSAEVRGQRLWEAAGPEMHVDRLGEFLLVQSGGPATGSQRTWVSNLIERHRLRGAYHKQLRSDVRGHTAATASPQLLLGTPAPESFPVFENGLRFEIRLAEGYSVGLFLDQRDNRRRLLVNHVAADFPVFPGTTPRDVEVLNVFAYTGAFSVCAARAGARTTSLDLSRKYLEWARRNFVLNDLDPTDHEFLLGDAFDWLRRLGRKRRQFDVVLLDPPTFSTSKQSGVFRAGADYGRLASLAVAVLKPGGLLFCSTNAAQLAPERFLASIRDAVVHAGRSIHQTHYAPQPPDFPVSRETPAYLKTVWLRLDVPSPGAAGPRLDDSQTAPQRRHLSCK